MKGKRGGEGPDSQREYELDDKERKLAERDREDRWGIFMGDRDRVG